MAGRILIIDDDPVLREVAGELLSMAGYRCASAEDGALGIKALEASQVDLVLLDMIMPNMDGIETLGVIKTRWPTLPVAVMSAGTRSMNSQSLLSIARSLGADAVIQKPLREASLLPLVAGLLAPDADAA